MPIHPIRRNAMILNYRWHEECRMSGSKIRDLNTLDVRLVPRLIGQNGDKTVARMHLVIDMAGINILSRQNMIDAVNGQCISGQGILRQ